MRRTRRVTPEIEMHAKAVINASYQRLLTFEHRPDGGFDWWGSGEPLVFLTAHGLQEFYEMSKVWEIDPRVLERSRTFLFAKQEKDGAWSTPGGTLHGNFQQLSGDAQKLGLTSYVLWSLLDAETPPSDANVQRGLAWLRAHIGDCKDPYILGVAALALLSADAKDPLAIDLLGRLDAMKTVEGKRVHWTNGTSCVTYACGKSADVETTGMVVLAMEKGGRHPNTVTQALDWIVSEKDANGNWEATQSTVLALKALIGGSPGTASQVKGKVTVKVNGQEAGAFEVTPDSSDLTRTVEAKRFVKKGDNAIEVEWKGEGSLLYQAVGRYYLPWNGQKPQEKEPLGIEVSYDRTELEKNDQVLCTVKATNHQGCDARMVILSVGIPPGFTPELDDLGNLVEGKKVAKFDQTSREAILYLDKLASGETQVLSFHLRARYPVRARSERSQIYEYYDPDKKSEAAPVEFRVK